MSSKGTASPNPTLTRPRKGLLPADDVRRFRGELRKLVNAKDCQGRKWAGAQWGVYAFYDYDGEPIYVGQTNERLSGRIGRHLTNQRTDVVAMRILDPFEVAEAEVWPLWDLEGVNSKSRNYADAKRRLDACEYTAYINAIEGSRFKAILNEKIPPISETVELPPSLRWKVVDDEVRKERGHPDIRIARRAETISRLAAVARERGEVSEGLRRVLVIQAVRLAYIAAERLAFVEGRPRPDSTAIAVERLVGPVLYEFADPYGEDSLDEDDDIDT
jgi:GIY-YIG catalytic domain-containing protein